MTGLDMLKMAWSILTVVGNAPRLTPPTQPGTLLSLGEQMVFLRPLFAVSASKIQYISMRMVRHHRTARGPVAGSPLCQCL